MSTPPTRVASIISDDTSIVSIDDNDSIDNLNDASSEFVIRRHLVHENAKHKSWADVINVNPTERERINSIDGADYDLHNKGNNYKSDFSLNLSGKNAQNMSSWELWWIASPLWRRTLMFIIVILGLIGIMQLVSALYFLGSYSKQNIRDPLLCTTMKCRALAKWMTLSANHSINPCENFYSFTCGNHKESDKGDIWWWWYKNYARIEFDGENGDSIVSKIFVQPKPSDVMGHRIIKYYQVCLKMWQTETLKLPFSLTALIQYVFKDFDIWGSEMYELEEAAARMIKLFGDYGFYRAYAPVAYPKVIVVQWEFITQIKKEYVSKFLPIIYDGLGIKNARVRDMISNDLYYMGAKLQSLVEHGIPLNLTAASPKCVAVGSERTIKMDDIGMHNNFDFELPYYIAYYGNEAVDFTNWKNLILKPGKLLSLTVDPLKGPKMSEHFNLLLKNWNCLVWERFGNAGKEQYIKPMYATLWSLRLLIELINDADDLTAEQYGLVDPTNQFFKQFQDRYSKRTIESRCYESMLDSMGYYPVFHFFLTTSVTKDYQKEGMMVVRYAASALLEEFRPVEEGGLAFVSSRFRERIVRILGNPDAINIMIPTKEDDRSFTQSPLAAHLEMGDEHIHNVIKWKLFTSNRARHYWLTGSPQRKLAWHRSFYQVDYSNVYEAPSTAPVALIRFPPSIFIYPYWNNDIEIANYAGARLLAAKSWMELLSADYARHNIEEDIKVKRENGERYWEGVTTDADYDPCEAVTYNWFYPDEDTTTPRRHALTAFDPHFLAIRYGFREYQLDANYFYSEQVEGGYGVFPSYLPIKIMLKTFFMEVKTSLREKPFWEYSPTTNYLARIRRSKLTMFEDFTEEQLYFLLYFRQVCRSKDSVDFYHLHVTENLAGLMQMKEFAKVWGCPPASPMNPQNRCFR